MTIREQIAQEQAAVTRLRMQLAARMVDLFQAEQTCGRSIDDKVALAHARLGVSSTQRLLAAHESSLEIIQRRASHEKKTRDRSA